MSSFLKSELGQKLLFAAVFVAALVVFFLVSRALSKLADFAHNAAENAASTHKSNVQVMLLRVGDVLARVASDSVSYIEQTMRPQIVGALEGGKLDASQAKQLRDAAMSLALDQLRTQWGRALEQIGVEVGSSLAPALGTLVDQFAQKLAGNSRETGTAPMPQSSALSSSGSSPADPPKPASA